MCSFDAHRGPSQNCPLLHVPSRNSIVQTEILVHVYCPALPLTFMCMLQFKGAHRKTAFELSVCTQLVNFTSLRGSEILMLWRNLIVISKVQVTPRSHCI